MKQITSIQNKFIKHLMLLQEKAKMRKETSTFIIEGKREVALALKGGYEVETILFCTELIVPDAVFLFDNGSIDFIEITKEVYQKLAYRDTTEGIIAVAKTKMLSLNDLQLPENPLIVVLESLEKPGNIGAILRTCDAARVDAVFIANAKTDLYNPNLIRSSLGCLFTNKIVLAQNEDIIAYFNAKNIAIYAATLQNSNVYYLEDYTCGCALVVGTEATGLTKIWRESAKQNIIIPMLGEIDSMNVSVSAAVLIYEAKRQRKF